MNSVKGFKYAIYAVICMLIFVGLNVLEIYLKTRYDYLNSPVLLLFIVLVVTGNIYSFKGITEEKSFKKIFGWVLNIVLLLVVIFTVVVSLLDFNNFLR